MNLLVGVALVLGLMIMIHEWGHFIVARMFGVRVDVFVHPTQGSVWILGADGFGDAPVGPDRRLPDVTVDEAFGVG